jgi:hypothetical protein
MISRDGDEQMISGYCQAREEFRSFLKTIDLGKYREEFIKRKYVEQDLPDDVVNTMLRSLYENYWEKKRFLCFDDWFEEVWKEISKLEEFTNFVWEYWHRRFGEDKEWDNWFKEGLKARLYRTWTAVLTQFDFCYTVECVVEEEAYKIPIFASPELNRTGVDLRLRTQEGATIDFQVYKISERKEARGKTGGVIRVPYPVTSREELKRRVESPNTRKRKAYETILQTFDLYYEELDNGFIVFKKELAKAILDRVILGQDVRSFVEDLAICLRGEKA